MDCRKCKYKDRKDLDIYCKRAISMTNPNALEKCFCLEQRYLLKYTVSGGYSNIYYAYDLDTKRIVLVKECYIEGEYQGRNFSGLLIPKPESKERISRKLALFIKETQKLNKLEYIGIFPKMYDFYRPDSYNAFLIMEYFDGCSIYNAKVNTSRQLLKLFNPVVKGLREMHRNNIIHRDLKSQNMILVDGKIKILDLGIAKTIYQNDNVEKTMYMMTEMLETSVAMNKPMEHQNHTFQDSRTDVYSLALLIKEAYQKFDITIPGRINTLLEEAMAPSIENRMDSISFYKAIYKKYERGKKIGIFVFSLGLVVSLFCLLVYQKKSEKKEIVQVSFSGYQEGAKEADEKFEEKREIGKNDVQRKQKLMAQIEEASGYELDDKYIGYTDFNADGVTELFAFVLKEIDETQFDPYWETEWINYGEVWFTDGENVVKVEEIVPDNWQGGGYYTTSLLQFGNTYHWQLHKWYGGITLSDGPSNIYVYEDGIPMKTKVGYINNFTLVDGGSDVGVYYSTVSETGFTTLHGRTWKKTYVYYKDRAYHTYESRLLDWEELKKYENVNEVVYDALGEMMLKDNSLGIDKMYMELDYFYVDGKKIYYYICEKGDSTQYITFFSCYENSSGRIYLNINIWNKENDFLKSKIWNDDDWNRTYPYPIDPSGDSQEEGSNMYITFTIEGNQLEIEEISSGFWVMEDSSSFGNVFNEWYDLGGKYHYHNQYGVEVKGDYEIDGIVYHFNENGELEGELSPMPTMN